MQSLIIQYLPFIFLGFIMLMTLVVAPNVFKSTKRKEKETTDSFSNLARRMGLQAKSNGVVGNYKGYHIDITIGVCKNYAYSTTSSGVEKEASNNEKNLCLEVLLTDYNNIFSSLAFYQSVNCLPPQQKIRDITLEREPHLPKMNINTGGLQNIQVYGTDNFTAEKIINNTQFRKLMSNGFYPDIRMSANQISLLLDSNNNLQNEVEKHITNNDYIIQATKICIAVANASKS